MRKKLSLLLLILLASSWLTTRSQESLRPDSIFKIMKRVADWQLSTWTKDGMRWSRNDWTNAAAYTGFMALNSIANDARYSNAMYSIGEAISWNTGPSRSMADDYCVGQMFSEMYELYREPKMIARFRLQSDSIAMLPHQESLEWKNNIALREWAWCDALFMGPPALTRLFSATGDRKFLDLADKLWWKTTDYLFDPQENLYFRDSRFFNRKESNGKKMFWSRGNGWVMGGLVRVLENMPADYPTRGRYIELYRKMAAKIASLQHADGSWHAALLDSVSYPAKETSGTGFYCYALAWGVNHGLLAYDQYYQVLVKAWSALKGAVHTDGKLGFVQQIGEKPEAVDYNSTEVYGVGAFLLAGTEMIQLLLKHSGEKIITLVNPTGLAKRTELIACPYGKFIEKAGITETGNFRIVNGLTGEEIPYQAEYGGNKKAQNLLMLLSFTPGSKIFALIKNESPAQVVSKVYCRYVPERYDDFAWENDRIAFRVYGAALEKTNENAYGMDVWAKRTSALVVDSWYKSGDYHVDHGEGLDYYHVGFSLGAGAAAPYMHDSIYYSKNYRRYKVLDNGPLRASFQLEYDGWSVDGMKVSCNKIISLDAGSQLNRIELNYSFTGKKILPLAIGIVKRKENGSIWLDERKGVMGYWEPEQAKDGILGVGVILPDTIHGMLVKEGHLLSLVDGIAGRPFIYYAGAAWNKAGLVTNAGEWIEYLENFRQALNRPVEIQW